jgi:hypothetical protein
LKAAVEVAPVVADPRLPAEKEFDDNTWQPPQTETPTDAVTAREFGQDAFQASGAAASQNAKLLEFFLVPHNFGLWFKATFLEELSGATRMNNRAVDLRKILVERGLYIDNYMIKPTEGGPVSSHYRICNIADALSLSAMKKQELLKHQGQPETEEIPVGQPVPCKVKTEDGKEEIFMMQPTIYLQEIQKETL